MDFFRQNSRRRGFAALPELQKRFSSVTASLILGILWAFRHLPNFFPK
jgi:membrane protease YdiL (CAAX protease family)